MNELQPATGPAAIQGAEVVLPCTELDRTLPFFTGRLGFRIDSIFPADDPAVVQLSGHGLRLRLERGRGGDPGILRLLGGETAAIAGERGTLTAPNGTRIEIAPDDPPVAVPPVQLPGILVSRLGDDAAWGTGRAGMEYRDLLPGRLGGYAIASHIRIPAGGPVPDYVHFHKIRFQMIYCARGWVRLVYEDQGPPFVMRAGDCVLQPPEIRHRVLESGDGLEVIEVGCPAEHMTCVDHALTLPTGELRPERDFAGQRFVFHQAAGAAWTPWRLPGFEARDTGIGAATGGLAGAKVVRRAQQDAPAPPTRHDADFVFLFLLAGHLVVDTRGEAPQRLERGDAAAIPAGLAHALTECSRDLELLEVTMPSRVETTADSA